MHARLAILIFPEFPTPPLSIAILYFVWSESRLLHAPTPTPPPSTFTASCLVHTFSNTGGRSAGERFRQSELG